MSLKELAPTYYTRLKEVTQEVNNCHNLFNAGCGDGFLDIFLKKKVASLSSLDLNEGDLKIARLINPEKNVHYYSGLLENLPFSSETFDVVVCMEVLEHLKNDQKAIDELIRVLKKGGKLIITVPSRNFPFLYDPINYILNKFRLKLNIGIWGWGHERLYTFNILKNKVGLKMIKRKRLSYSIAGLCENSYISNFLQRFTKNDPKNKGQIRVDFNKIKNSVFYTPPFILTRIRDAIIYLDKMILFNSKKSVGLMVIFEK